MNYIIATIAITALCAVVTILWAAAAVTAIATELMALDEGEYIGDCDEWQ